MSENFNQGNPIESQSLGLLQDYFSDHRALPSYSHMQKMLNIKSKDTVSKLMAQLRLLNFLSKAPDGKLIPGKRFFERPLAGSSVQAGALTEAYDNAQDYITIDEHLVEKPSRTQLISVKGDSMKDVGIMDGDTVVVEKRDLANIGDIVVAIVDNVFTIKTLGKVNGQFVLIPANKDFATIRPKEGFAIYGVVVGQFRKY